MRGRTKTTGQERGSWPVVSRVVGTGVDPVTSRFSGARSAN